MLRLIILASILYKIGYLWLAIGYASAAFMFILVSTITCTISMVTLYKCLKRRRSAGVVIRNQNNNMEEEANAVQVQANERRQEVEYEMIDDVGRADVTERTYMEVEAGEQGRGNSFEMEGNVAYGDAIATRQNEAYEHCSPL